jgi:hypothetical protein
MSEEIENRSPQNSSVTRVMNMFSSVREIPLTLGGSGSGSWASVELENVETGRGNNKS